MRRTAISPITPERIAVILGSLAILFFAGGCAGGPEPFVRGDLLVMVYSSDHEPILDATLRSGRRILGRSDSFGRLVAPDLRAGEQELLIAAPGFAPEEVEFTFRNATQILYISMEPLGRRLATLLRRSDEAELRRLHGLQEAAVVAEEERALTEALLAAIAGEEHWEATLGAATAAAGKTQSAGTVTAVGEALSKEGTDE